MTMGFSLPENCKIVEALTPQAGAALTGDYVSLKNVQMAYVVVHINQAAADVVAITLERATTVAGTGHVAIANVVPIWVNADCAASDVLVEQTAAVGFTTDAGQKHKIIVFQVDPAGLGAYDCLTVVTAASNAGNITAAMYYLVPRYASRAATQPTVITD
jgi:hypothetical protein